MHSSKNDSFVHLRYRLFSIFFLLISYGIPNGIYAVETSLTATDQLDMLTCSLMGYKTNGNTCTQKPADAVGSQLLYTRDSSFLDALNRTIQGPQNDHLDDFMAHLSASRSGGFSTAFHKKLLGLMSQVATDIMSGKGNRWGASNLSLQTISNTQALLNDLNNVFNRLRGTSSASADNVLENMVGSQDPQINVEKVLKSIYPVFRQRSIGRFEWQGGCGGGENRFPGGVSDNVRNTCSFSQRVKYAQLLTTSCAQSWHQGPYVTSDKIGVTQCGSSFPVSKGSGDATGSQSASSSDADAFQISKAGVFQGCSATLCTSDAPGGAAIPSHQTKQAQLLNGWADTCQSLKNLQQQSCSNLVEGDAKQACLCLQKYLRGYSNISECVSGCSLLRSGGGGDYSQRQACPPIPGGFSAGQADSHTVKIANRAQGDITNIAPCLQYAEQEAGKAIAAAIWSRQASSNSSTESAFGSVYTLLGPDKYEDGTPSTESTAYSVVRSLFNANPRTSFEFESYLDTRSLDTNQSKQAELLIALLNGAFANSAASPIVPTLPETNNGSANFLRNGRFMSSNSQGQLLTDLSGRENPQFKLQGGGSEVSKILQTQNAALSSVQSSRTQYTQSQQQSARMQILLMSIYYEMFAQRALVDRATQLTPQQIRKTSATWRLDPTVAFSTSSTSDATASQPASISWSRCDNASSSGCSSWSSHLGDFSFTELLRETTRLLTDMHALQYEMYEMQNRIQLLQALSGAADVSKVKQGLGQSEVSIQKFANQIYAGKAGQSVAQGVQSMPAVPTTGS